MKSSNKPSVITPESQVKNVVKTLSGLMKDVTKNECTPSTVNAACNCASSITELLKLHLEAEKLNYLRKSDV